ncbi:MAG: hypothetical protein UU64_C0004G0032 [candidate division WWE3 bacterium GW2011_GWF2_41_45]|uniref:Uncharacterized protein n=1 Tax=candidate division WWE3 bacterium GW2011_GWC2_41_23 TaxID=1619123 RepID=A0A0G0YRE9_UNCKA|nr:MAG: hypothetical protein UU55_C0007G0018 [candidate division WWE3 bacterium GW2011_GWC2_41_23]KKS10435.1 MAG: hypothetical protein UU64_C0004G0032 [candidate division WWE3 bacterium GW2011_GWF2_41_45]KKS20084.1 MAG: hypothetical protein UU79_C0004G0031 [candidate division WWE3 bacterium GW2011_GWE1_41_72]KKS29465.1 MAG: hypothetical protein UU90_C0009G0018 [candidate division WWE3 bacterium GW2011_GWD2_42_11]KKS50696.1 MAG: hypothetical protein UV16_C0007G0064 [candidate division WWE3 bacte
MGDQKTTEEQLQDAYDKFLIKMLALKLEKLEIIRKYREKVDAAKLKVIDESLKGGYAK